MFEIGAKFGNSWEFDGVCKVCGENKSKCKCQSTNKILPIADHNIKISVEKRKNKVVTVAKEFFLGKKGNDDLAKELKKKVGVGGSAKENQIELQGRVEEKLKALLIEKGFKVR